MSGIRVNNVTDSSNSSSGSMVFFGGLSINDTANSSSVTSGGALTISGGASINKDIYVGGNSMSGVGTLGPFIMLQTQYIDVTSGSYTGYTAANTVLFMEPGNPGTNGAIGYTNGFGSGNLSNASNEPMGWNYARLIIRGSSLYTNSSSSTIRLSPFLVQSATGTMYTQTNFNVTDNGSTNGYMTWISPWISTTTLNDIQSVGIKVVGITTGNTVTSGNVRIGPTYLQFKF